MSAVKSRHGVNPRIRADRANAKINERDAFVNYDREADDEVRRTLLRTEHRQAGRFNKHRIWEVED